MQIETVAMPTYGTALAVENVPMPGRATKPTKAKTKKVKKDKATKVRDALKRAAEDYKSAYKALYGMAPVLTYDGTWIRIKGESQGFNLQRLKERTAQLRNRKG